MKKKYLLCSILFILSSCSFNSFSSSSKGNISITDFSKIYTFVSDSKLIFSEIMTDYNVANRAIEIANIGDKDIDLKDYTVSIFRNGVNKASEVISLSGTIQKEKTYVIAYSYASEEIKAKANLVTDLYMNDGTFGILLTYQKDKYVDVLGTPGYSYDYAKGVTMVRKKEYFKTNNLFSAYSYIKYPVGSLTTLGNLNVISEADLLKGPRLTNEDASSSFALSDTIGGGGLIKVSVTGYIDGDTSRFNYGSSLSKYGISGSLSTRYYGINTPEIAHSSGEVSDPYGDEAKAFTDNMLRNAKSVIIQSVRNSSLHETYGRMLGYVWIANTNNPSLEDYELLNFRIIQNGFSNVGFLTRSNNINDMIYNDISYAEYLFDAENYARINKLNLHS